MEILKYIEKEKGKIEKQKESKEKRIEDLKIKIKKLEKKVNTETEKESVIVRSEAKIKVFKNRIKVIELESIGELDKEYIIKETDKNIEQLNADLKENNKKNLKKIYDILEEMAIYQDKSNDDYLKLIRVLRNERIQGYFNGQFEVGRSPRNFHISEVVKKDNAGVYLELNRGYGVINKLNLYKKDFK